MAMNKVVLIALFFEILPKMTASENNNDVKSL